MIGVRLDLVAGRQAAHMRMAVGAEADVAAARRAVAALVQELRVDGPGRVELVVTELATNLVRHAGGGWLLARALTPSSIELIAVDEGPGIRDLDAILAGTSHPTPPPAATGLGCGLRAVKRASARFDVWTRPGHSIYDARSGVAFAPRTTPDRASYMKRPGRGTVVLSVVDLAPGRKPEPAPRCCAGLSVGIVEPCGDGWAVASGDGVLSVAVVDGLGHGAKASTATDAALAEFAADPHDLEHFVPRANLRMRDTRGAAVTLCRIAAGELTCLAIGNVNGRVVTREQTRGLVTYSGTLGLHLEPPKARIATVPFPAGASLVLWTDGLSSRLDLDPDLLAHDPAVVAATLHRDHTRNRDDATVVVVTPRADR